VPAITTIRFGKFAQVAALGWSGFAQANNGVVGPGSCNEAGFVGVLNAVQSTGGGTITFNCGTAPTTIVVSTHRQISSAVTIDGGNRIVFDGNGASAFFLVSQGQQLTLRGMTLTRGTHTSISALQSDAGTLVIENSTISNTGPTFPAIMSNGWLTLRSSILRDNAAGQFSGGALYVTGETRIEQSTLVNNTSNYGGGAIFQSGGSLIIVDSTFSANHGFEGGAILVVGPTTTTTIANSTFSDNSGGYGGAIEFGNSATQVRNSIFIHNNASGLGGAIYTFGETLNIDGVQFTENDSAEGGGAIGCTPGGFAKVRNSMFAGNSAPNGGAIAGSLELDAVNVTFHANRATGTNGVGGAIAVSSPTAGRLAYATIDGNIAASAGGIFGNLVVSASLIASNSGGNCGGSVTSLGYNVVDNADCVGFTETGDLHNASLPLSTPGNFGGPTLTQAPLAGNAGIDRIPLAECTNSYDQRGAVRPAGAGCDSGAFEVGAEIDRLFVDNFE
jgi:predicted outer membrane repeat protein